MGVLAIYASRTCIMVVISTGYSIADVIVVDVVAHGRKEKTDISNLKKENLGN